MIGSDKSRCHTSKIVLKWLCTPLVDELLTWIWNHAIAIGTIIMKTFFNHEHWKHFQCFHRNICTVVINVLLILTSFLLFLFLFLSCLPSFCWPFELNFFFWFHSMFCFSTLLLFTFTLLLWHTLLRSQFVVINVFFPFVFFFFFNFNWYRSKF